MYFFLSTTHLSPYSTTKPNSHSQMTTSIDTTTTTAPQQLRNHGQKWTAEEDLQLKDAPGLDDDHFSLLLGRSTHAVQSRRAMLAARLHATTGRPVVECAEQMCANVTKTLFIAEGGDGEERMKKKKERQGVLDGMRVNGGGQERKKVSIGIDRYSQMNSIKPRPMASYSARSHAATAPVGVVNVASKQASPISIVCSFIKRHAGGDMDELWAQEALVPTLVQYHAGFMAYAAFLKAKWSR